MQKMWLSVFCPKEWEDAFPYHDDKTLIVCDGLGKSGSEKHKISNVNIEKYNEIVKCIIKDDFFHIDDGLNSYYKELFNIPNEMKDNQTSAFWASRIILTKYSYYLKCGKSVYKSEDLKKELLEGLNNFKEKTKIERRLNDRSIELLPTTMVSIRLSDDEKKATAIWAGDSRGYLLTSSGLQQITRDDEDEGKALTNLFSAEKSKTTTINTNTIVLPEKGILFVASDGIFDLFDESFLLEELFLKFLNDTDSIVAFEKKISDYYDDNKTDDVSMMMLFFGYEKFTDIKEDFKKRYDEINKIKEMIDKYYPLISDSDALLNSQNYVVNRFFDIKDKLLTLLLEKYKNNENDPYLDAINECFLNDLLLTEKNNFEIDLKKNKYLIAKKLIKDYVDGLNDRELETSNNPELKKLIDNRIKIKKAIKNYKEKKKIINDEIDRKENIYSISFGEAKKAIDKEISNLESKVVNPINLDNLLDWSKNNAKTAKKFKLRRDCLAMIDSFSCDFKIKKKLSISDDSIVEYLNGLVDFNLQKYTPTKGIKADKDTKKFYENLIIEKKQALLTKYIGEKLKELLSKSITIENDEKIDDSIEKCLNTMNIDEFLKNNGKLLNKEDLDIINRKFKQGDTQEIKNSFMSNLNEIFSDKKEIKKIVETVAKKKSQSSLDSLFTASRLQKYRECVNADLEEVAKVKIIYDNYQKKYNELIEGMR